MTRRRMGLLVSALLFSAAALWVASVAHRSLVDLRCQQDLAGRGRQMTGLVGPDRSLPAESAVSPLLMDNSVTPPVPKYAYRPVTPNGDILVNDPAGKRFITWGLAPCAGTKRVFMTNGFAVYLLGDSEVSWLYQTWLSELTSEQREKEMQWRKANPEPWRGGGGARPNQPTLVDAERVQLRVVDQGRRLGLRWRYLGAIGSEQTRGLKPVYRPGTWELFSAEQSTTLLKKSDIVLCFGILPSDLAPVAHQIDERKGIVVYLPQSVSLDSRIAEGCTVGQFVRAVCLP